MRSFDLDTSYKLTNDSKYPYEVRIPQFFYTHIFDQNIQQRYLQLTPDGILKVSIGYRWNGASGFPDLKTIMLGSLVHDALWQLIELKLLDTDHRGESNRILYKTCRKQGMNFILAEAVYVAVTTAGVFWH